MKKVYGLIGGSLGHSFSPQIHEEIFRKLEIEGEYKLFELKENELGQALQSFMSQGIIGVNVTVPYKISIMPYLDSISDEAARIGAVNTVAFGKGVMSGYNTDYHGFGMSLARNGITIAGRSAVILGTGGVSRSAGQYLKDNGAGSIVYVSRKPGAGEIGYEELYGAKGDLIINCTPCGMYPYTDESPVSADILKGFHTAVDLIYNPEETLFIRQAGAFGLKTVNGLYMLVSQAVAAQEIWNGIRLEEIQVDEIYDLVKSLLYCSSGGQKQ